MQAGTRLAPGQPAPGFSLALRARGNADRSVMAAWGAFGEKQMYGRTTVGVLRSTFLVDAEGTIEAAQYGVKATGHVGRLLRDLAL